VCFIQYNSPLPRQTAGQNRVKLLDMFNYISKIVPWNAWVNELIFEKIAYGGSCKQDEAPLKSQRTYVSKSKAVKLTQPKI